MVVLSHADAADGRWPPGSLPLSSKWVDPKAETKTHGRRMPSHLQTLKVCADGLRTHGRHTQSATQLNSAFTTLLQLLLAAWIVACSLLSFSLSYRLQPGARNVLWLYFQPLVPPLLLLWFWGSAVKRFTAMGIDYETCFAAKDRRYMLSGQDIQQVCRQVLALAGVNL